MRIRPVLWLAYFFKYLSVVGICFLLSWCTYGFWHHLWILGENDNPIHLRTWLLISTFLLIGAIIWGVNYIDNFKD